MTRSSSSEDSIGSGTLGAGGSLSPVRVGAIKVKSSSAFDGLEDWRFAIDFAFTGLVRGEGPTLLIVLFAGLVWLELAWLEWLVFGLVVSFLGGLVLLALGVLVFRVLEADGLMVSLLLGAWPGLLTEYGPAVAGLAAISGRRNLVGRIGATERPP